MALGSSWTYHYVECVQEIQCDHPYRESSLARDSRVVFYQNSTVRLAANCYRQTPESPIPTDTSYHPHHRHLHRHRIRRTSDDRTTFSGKKYLHRPDSYTLSRQDWC